ncbi:MAG: FkbM family methyltransferase [Phascolarctobacterium sp.]|uniref:FkbM family methyltransferase n=1 Tax=Phascolarctobacterium sp. TaxID=2049039 RepID=UPI0026DA9162|nr:FkbM family methyltransferase [Phascolarctobacterium sp.]MDO4921041.1 FkbM family methyltransferase [Phascolarctobacterium sp.]
MLDFITEKESVWQVLKNTTKPVVLYGMGNGADKILDWCEASGVKVAGVFASDEFVRGQQFRGFTVERYDALKARLGNDLLIVVAFASERPEVLARFARLDAEGQAVAPHLPLFDERETVSFAWLAKYESELRRVYDKLADDWSRKVFADVLNYKVSGKLQYLFGCATEREEDLRTLLKPGADEIYLDLGAYNGDTLEELGRLTDWRWRLALAVEPDRRNCLKLRQTAEALVSRGLPVEVYESGIWDCAGALSFSDSGGRQSTFVGAAKKSVAVTTIDEVAAGRPVSYIKMDVEGAEAQAIAGGRATIAQFKPKMFLAAYHYDADIFRLPLLLWQLVPEYKIYLRKHPYVPAWELNFICTL